MPMEPIYPNEQPIHAASVGDAGEFDERFSTRPLRILKALTPLLPERMQPAIAMCIRLQELKIALNLLTGSAFYRSTDGPVHSDDMMSPEFLNQIFNRLEPLLSYTERSTFQKLRQTMQMFETMKQLEPLMQFFAQMQESNKESTGSSEETGTDNNAAKGADISDLFSSLSGFGNLSELSNLSGLARLSGLYSPVSETPEAAELKAEKTQVTPIQPETDFSHEIKTDGKEEL